MLPLGVNKPPARVFALLKISVGVSLDYFAVFLNMEWAQNVG